MIVRARSVVRSVVVTVGVIALTSFTVDATLNSGGVSQSALGILATSLTTSEDTSLCPPGMTPLHGAVNATCIDQYEASPSDRCPMPSPKNAPESQQNVTAEACMAVSVLDAEPWRYVTREQATLACAKAGKRLPTNEEWYKGALGTPDPKDVTPPCHIDGDDVVPTGTQSSCVSAIGAYDMIGNVWEWVSGDVYDGTYNGRRIPESGYVTQVDSDGVPIYTSSERADVLFFEDYTWSSESGAFGIIRGGHYGNTTDAGVYTLNAYTLPTTPGKAIGFRCVK